MRTSMSWTPQNTTERIDEKLDEKKRAFLQTNEPQLVSFRSWCEEWDWARRSDVYTHLIHPYPAKLLAYIPIAFLTSSYAPTTGPVLDCFAGTGTVLLECMVHKFKPTHCYGVEINPLARLIAKVKTTPLLPHRLERLAEGLYKRIDSTLNAPIPQFTNLDFWFRKSAQNDLARIRQCIERMEASPGEQDFFRVCLSAIVRDMSRADPDVAPPVLLKLEKFPKLRQDEIRAVLRKKQRAKAIPLFKTKVSANLARIRHFVAGIGQPPKAEGWIIWDDAREMKKGRYTEAGQIEKAEAQPLTDAVGMVITSPPYMAAQKYVRTTKLEMLWLGLLSEDDLRQLDRSAIGTERVTEGERSEIVRVDNATADSLIDAVHKSSLERAAIASRYYRDMRQCLIGIHRALRPGGICVLVVGNNTICQHTANSHAILCEIAAENGMFSTEMILRDPIRSRGLITKRHDTAGVIDDEYVLVLRKQAIPSI